ncbi:MAG TPA: copper amine oxidase N-terminal domain-containing protein [bacterium]|nr:copper amine oxidase N-terminal domain-containing protein [bacterium]
MFASGRVLVPLRGVFERLGASVTWAPASQTVLAQRDTTSVSLKIGSSQAFVNGQAQVVDVPPMLVGGRTMIPLRFVSQALGARVHWDAATATVQITNPGAYPPSASYPPAQMQAPATQTITGTVTLVDAAVYPGQLSIQASDGAIYTFRVVSGTTITRTDLTTSVTGPVSLEGVEGGDFVTITADQRGTARSVQASYDAVNGTVAAVAYDQIVLRNGQAYTLSPAARILLNGRAVTAAAIRPGDAVAIRVNPETGQAYGVTVRRVPYIGAVTSVTVRPAGRQLVPGDVVTVVARGPEHGHATFSITGLRGGLPMTESVNRADTYFGSYTVQPGDNVVDGRVVVTVTAPNGQLVSATAPVPVSIESSVIIPPAVGGAPVITSPAPASDLTIPFTVTGTAPPGSRVRVAANYRGKLVLLNVRGTLGTETVVADANGNWSATFYEAPPVRDVEVTISAVRVDDAGAARSPSIIVNTTLN